MILKTSYTKAVAASMVILLGSVIGARAETFTVTNTNDSGAGSLRQAVLDSNAAAGSDTIVFDASFGSAKTITLASMIFIDPAVGDALTITGPGPGLLKVSGNDTVQIFFLGTDDTASISGMTLTLGRNNNGGAAIDNRGSLNVSNIAFTSNATNNSGAALSLNFNTTTTVANCSFTSNSAGGSSAIDNNGSLTVTNSTFTANTGGYGAIANSRTMTLTGCTFTDNTSTGGGSTSTGGGAIYSSTDGNGTVTIVDCKFTGNKTTVSQSGGAIANRSGTMDITNSIFTNNRAAANGGGAISSGEILSVSGCTFTGNSTNGSDTSLASYGRGGAIFSFGRLTIANTMFTGNSATIDGGAIFYVASGPDPALTITDSTLANNIANSDRDYAGDGGAIYIRSEFAPNVISRCTFSGNVARNNTKPLPDGPVSFGNGGGVFSETQLTVDNCTISGNTAASRGGGIYDSYTGGGMSQFVITNSTIVNNQASQGGGIRSSDSVGDTPTNVGNTIVASNSGGDILNPIVSQGYNLIGGDPKLGALAENGGPTKTHALLPGSPAIDQGKRLSDVQTDQRGVQRPTDNPAIANASGGDGSDIGAYEIGASNGVAEKTLGNISTRLPVLTGDNVPIAGIIVAGSVPKRVIIRALGPSLTAAGIDGALENPTLQLFRGNTLLAENDNWREDQEMAISQTGVAPSDNREAAIVRTLEPGNYTAVVRGKDDTTGIGLVEAYDLNQRPNSKLVNISTRGVVDSGDNVLIGGFIVGPTTQVVVRAIGPSLGDAGVQGALQDPVLSLVNANGEVVRANDDWKGIQREEIKATGLQPTRDSESALVATLTAGSYTAVVRSADNSGGIGLVEVYNLR